MAGKDVEARISQVIEANGVGTHAFQVGLAAKQKKGDAAAWSAGGLAEADLQALVRHQQGLLAEKPQAVKAWAEGAASDFDPARDLRPLLASPLKAAAAGLPVNVLAAYFQARTKAGPLRCRAVASLLQMMLDVDRDGDRLQEMFALYVALGLPVHTAALGLPEKTDEEFMAVAADLAPKMAAAPVDTTPAALRMMFRKMCLWGHRWTGERDRRTVARELLAEPEVRAILPKVKAMPAQKIATLGHSFTMEVNWASPSAFVPFVTEILKETNPKVEIRQWAGGGLNPARPDCRTFVREILAWKPDRVLIVVWTQSPENRSALDKMVGEFRAAGAEVMMFDALCIDNPDVGTPPDVIRDLVARHGLTQIEVRRRLEASPDRPRFVCLDGIHMTEPYHRLMAKEWLKYLAGARGAKLGG